LRDSSSESELKTNTSILFTPLCKIFAMVLSSQITVIEMHQTYVKVKNVNFTSSVHSHSPEN
jgi:hypothetical protein